MRVTSAKSYPTLILQKLTVMTAVTLKGKTAGTSRGWFLTKAPGALINCSNASIAAKHILNYITSRTTFTCIVDRRHIAANSVEKNFRRWPTEIGTKIRCAVNGSKTKMRIRSRSKRSETQRHPNSDWSACAL